jgi:monofunctional glycosyltransferase
MLNLLLRAIALVTAAFLVLTVVLVLPWRWLPLPTTSFMLQERFGDPKTRPPAMRHRWVPLEEISTSLAIAVIASEDQKFTQHQGFDFESISKAMNEPRKRPRGASTISQQLVKNIYLWPGRSFVRKGLEAYLTVAVEALWPKRRILEAYLNVAQFGPGIYGADAAARSLFGKPPSKLTLYESSLLAAVLPNPRRMSASRPSAYVAGRAQDIRFEVYRMGGEAVLAPLSPVKKKGGSRE